MSAMRIRIMKLSVELGLAQFFLVCLPLSLLGQNSDKGLKDAYKDYFPIGVAVSPQVLSGDERELILKNFNSLTAENVMKIGPIHPEESRYNWEPADKIVAFAEEHGMKMRGHTLVWHNQTPAWLFKDDNGNQVSKEVLLQRMKDHITTVVTRYKGKIYAWDVVNEVIDDSAPKVYRESLWYQICGEEFIAKAFRWAHEADPEALLFYNDYNTENPIKRKKIIDMVKKLRADGVPVHGIGLQGHWSIFEPSESSLRASLAEFAGLGLPLQITELDVSVYRSEPGRREKQPGESDVFTTEMEQMQFDQYKMFFKTLREFKSSISGVTFWNVTDKRTWLDNFPVRGRKNYPLLFDQDLKPKRAYWEVLNFDDQLGSVPPPKSH